jgi:hypothetical protein
VNGFFGRENRDLQFSQPLAVAALKIQLVINKDGPGFRFMLPAAEARASAFAFAFVGMTTDKFSFFLTEILYRTDRRALTR